MFSNSTLACCVGEIARLPIGGEHEILERLDGGPGTFEDANAARAGESHQVDGGADDGRVSPVGILVGQPAEALVRAAGEVHFDGDGLVVDDARESAELVEHAAEHRREFLSVAAASCDGNGAGGSRSLCPGREAGSQSACGGSEPVATCHLIHGSSVHRCQFDGRVNRERRDGDFVEALRTRVDFRQVARRTLQRQHRGAGILVGRRHADLHVGRLARVVHQVDDSGGAVRGARIVGVHGTGVVEAEDVGAASEQDADLLRHDVRILPGLAGNDGPALADGVHVVARDGAAERWCRPTARLPI